MDIEEDTPIYIGEINEKHIKNKHPYEYKKYFSRIKEIIETPTFILTLARSALEPNLESIALE